MAHTPIWSDLRYAVVFRGAEALLAHIACERWLDPALADLWAVRHRLVLRAAIQFPCEPPLAPATPTKSASRDRDDQSSHGARGRGR